MRRIIRLTERDLTRLVKRTITELDRSTYEKASDVAGEKGFNKLSDKFREHGREFGLGREKSIIVMVTVERGEETELYVRVDSIKNTWLNNSGAYTMVTRQLDTDKKLVFELSVMPSKIEFYLNGEKCLPATRKDAIKVLKMFESEIVDVSKIDPRSISYDDTGL